MTAAEALLPERDDEALSRARAREAKTPEERVELICEWMAKGLYLPGDDKKLAPVWGVGRPTVRGYAAEARRMLARELLSRSRDELLAELLARVSFIGQDALERTEEAVTKEGDVVTVRRPDHRTALRAAEATGELLGLKIQRHHHTHSAAELTTEQIVSQLEQHGVRVQLPALSETTGETVEEHGDKEEATEGQTAK